MNTLFKATVALSALLAWQASFAQTVQPDPKVKVEQGTGAAGTGTAGTAGTAGGTAGGTATGAAATATGAAAGGAGFGVGTLLITGAAAAGIAATSNPGSTSSHTPTTHH